MLVDDEGRAILADFGFTAVRNSLGLPMTSSSVEVGGTVVFMAPELLETEGPSTTRILKKPADIYALGMLIYEVLPRVVYFTMAQAHTLTGTLRGAPVSRPQQRGDQESNHQWEQT